MTTHNDIYTKFMIEYDKANVTSSYPSLTEFEVATFLDKAYNAIIAQKITGNNTRRSTFESDTKSVEDLRPIVVTKQLEGSQYAYDIADGASAGTNNVVGQDLPDDYMYFVQLLMYEEFAASATTGPIDQGVTKIRSIPTKLVSHNIAEKYFATAHNIPWVKDPVCFIEDNRIYEVVDAFKLEGTQSGVMPILTYIKQPNKFAKNLDDATLTAACSSCSYFQYTFNAGATNEQKEYVENIYTFELNDTLAEELVNLAISFALENVESPRLSTKLNMRGLEA